jgi:uncharacterized membrane protein
MIVAGVNMTFFVVGAGLIVVNVLALWCQFRAANCLCHVLGGHSPWR